jgi:pantoate--beta-alanine ligase
MLAKEPQFKLEYFEIANGISLESLNTYEANTPTALCIAAFLGDVRLIDNILID